MATNWVDEVLSGATSTGSKTLSLATGNTLSVANSESESIFTVTSDTTNGGYTSILGIEGQEAVLFLGADNADDAGDAWEIHSDTSGNFKIGNRTSGTGSPTRANTFTNSLTIDSSRNVAIAGDLTITGGDLTLGSVNYLSDSGGTGTLKNIDALDATTEATIEAAMDTLPNVTSVGTLTTLTVDNVIVNGTTIGHTSDTDLMTLASGALTVAGTLTTTGVVDITSTQASTDISGDTGALRCEGGASIAGKLYVGGNAIFGEAGTTSSQVTIYNNLDLTQVAGDTAGQPNFVITNYDAGNGAGSEMLNMTWVTSKSDSASWGTTDADASLGRIAVYGSDGSDKKWAGQLTMRQQGTYNGNSADTDTYTAGIPSEWRINSQARLTDNKGVQANNLTWGASDTGHDDNKPNLVINGAADVCTAGMGTQIAIKNGTAPSSAINNYTCIGSKDIGSDSALEITQEEAVASEAVTSDRTLQVTINGAIYKILLDYVSGE